MKSWWCKIQLLQTHIILLPKRLKSYLILTISWLKRILLMKFINIIKLNGLMNVLTHWKNVLWLVLFFNYFVKSVLNMLGRLYPYSISFILTHNFELLDGKSLYIPNIMINLNYKRIVILVDAFILTNYLAKLKKLVTVSSHAN